MEHTATWHIEISPEDGIEHGQRRFAHECGDRASPRGPRLAQSERHGSP